MLQSPSQTEVNNMNTTNNNTNNNNNTSTSTSSLIPTSIRTNSSIQRNPSSQPRPPPSPTTLTEKVDEHTTGWEMWVADENLMKELGGSNNLPPPSTTTTTTTTTTPNHNRIRTPSSNQTQPIRPPLTFTITPLIKKSSRRSHRSDQPAGNSLKSTILSPPLDQQTSNEKMSPTNTYDQQLDQANQTQIQPRTSISSPPNQSIRPSFDNLSSLPKDSTRSQSVLSNNNNNTTTTTTKNTTNNNTELSNKKMSTDDNAYQYAYEMYDRKVSRVSPNQIANDSSAFNWATANPQPPRPSLALSPAPPAPQPNGEICVECMMRDRDMADVQVTGPGVWARKSDLDFEEAMTLETQMDERDELESLHSRVGGNHTTNGQPFASTSREGSSLGNDSMSSGLHRTNRRKRLGTGNPLTQPALKAWTQMNPPAASHRWRTLQMYLKEQAHYLELEHKAKLATKIENERAEQALRSSFEILRVGDRPGSTRSNSKKLNRSSSSDYNFFGAKTGNRQSTILSNGLVLETVDVSRDEKELAKARTSESKSRPSLSGRRFSVASNTRNTLLTSPSPTPRSASNQPSPYMGGQGDPSNDMLSQAATTTPYLTASPLSPNTSHTRAPSPSKLSVASRKSFFTESIRPFSTWSRNTRRSITHSVLSFAPSGSMVDMHIGLSQDRHHSQHLSRTIDGNLSPNEFGPGSVSPQPVHSSLIRSSSPSKDQKVTHRKKGFKGLLLRLGLRHRKSADSYHDLIDPRHTRPNGVVTGEGGMTETGINLNGGYPNMMQDDEPLAPPPSLSVLAREHRRNPSALSLPLSTQPTKNRNQHPASHLESTSQASSPVSQSSPLSPGFKKAERYPSTYFSSLPSDDPRYDTLAEELIVPSSTVSIGKPPTRHRSQSEQPTPDHPVTSLSVRNTKSLSRIQGIEEENEELSETHPIGGPHSHSQPNPTNRLRPNGFQDRWNSESRSSFIEDDSPIEEDGRRTSSDERNSSRRNRASSFRNILTKSFSILPIQPNRVQQERRRSVTTGSKPPTSSDRPMSVMVNGNEYVGGDFKRRADQIRRSVSRSGDLLALRYVSPGGLGQRSSSYGNEGGSGGRMMDQVEGGGGAGSSHVGGRA